ncbi:hypothetical protein CDAR_510061 [Caerostris darwini]|uniref:Uncharacterized protein n=1 Tax=Caerostris darwini TaxID=1538125 RepID=A0AAV4X2U2_9ARAC|nr:hypothetical protein CDAR_510061 [Caerostris darwini]
MKSSIPLLLLSFCWIASFGNCDRSYRVIEKIRNSGKHNQPAEQEQCMAEMRKACGASECCRKLFLLDESYAKSNKEHASKMEDKPQTSEERRREEEDVEEEEDESESSSFGDDYPKSAGKSPKSEDDDESDPVKQRKRKEGLSEVAKGVSFQIVKVAAVEEDHDSRGSRTMAAGDSNSGRRWWQYKMTVAVEDDDCRGRRRQ